MQSITIRDEAPRRPLYIKFESYAHFKRELIELMIENLQDLQQAYALSSAQQDMTLFVKACHRTKTTLHILEDKEFMDLVDELKQTGTDAEGVCLFHKLTAEIITSLWIENENGELITPPRVSHSPVRIALS